MFLNETTKGHRESRTSCRFVCGVGGIMNDGCGSGGSGRAAGHSSTASLPTVTVTVVADSPMAI